MILFVFLAGLAIGSFLNAYIFRLAHNANDHEARNEGPRKVSVWRGRSYCPKCKKALRWYELIPLVSFAVQFGRCRGCKQKIDWQYPAVELATGLLFVLGLQIVNNQFTGYGLRVTGYVTTGYLLSVLVILFVYDLRYGLVPDRVVLPAIAVAFLYSIVSVSRESENGLLLTTYYFLYWLALPSSPLNIISHVAAG
ncbi:prepilin peptidase [Candidatus Uhrbacteria bacterium]|nr:prepilin peptidase [Candidatus Uhrbacteria bacterium]